ncbi:helix-turn-helix transcriptional regulator, partial [Escherichia coli]|nr:helix-turn-helix transcriptional regulator [Escherichia coli]
MNIGNRVRQLRQAKNMKIADLAEAIGVDAANISRLETGKQKQFTEQALSNIARSLGVDIADLFTSDFKSNTVCKNSISEDVAQVKDVFRIEMLDVSASAGNGLIQGGDVIDVIHAIEYRTDNAVSMFGGRPANHIKVINVRGDSMCPTIEPGDLIFVDVSI